MRKILVSRMIKGRGVVLLTNSNPALDPVFLQFGPFTVYWYGIIIITGVIIGLFLATKEANRFGLKKDLIIDLMVFAVPIAIVFARVYYVVFEWEQYANKPWWEVFAVWNGGISIHVALISLVFTIIFFIYI